MSTQSNVTIVSEGASVADTDAHHDDSMIPLVEPTKTAKSGRGAKKGAKAKKPAPKSKRQASKVLDESIQVASSFLEPEDDNFEVKVETNLTQGKGNKKRKSDDMSGSNDLSNNPEVQNQEEESQDQSRKRRITRTRGSVAQSHNAPDPPPQDEHDHDAQRTDAEEIPPSAPPHARKKGKGGNKRGSSNVRKASNTSTASKASLRATIPHDEEIDAALEADLDRPLTDDEDDVEPSAMSKPKGRRLTKTKPGSRKATASVAPTRRTTEASTATIDDLTMQDIYPSLPEPAEEIEVPTPEKNDHAALVRDAPEDPSPPEIQNDEKVPERLEQQDGYSKETELEEPEEGIAGANPKIDEEMPTNEPPHQRERQASRQLPARHPRVSDISKPFEAMDVASDINSSTLDTQTAHDDSGHETDASVVKQARTKRGNRKAPTKRAKGGKKAVQTGRNVEEIMQPAVDDTSPKGQGTHTDLVDGHPGDVGPASMEVKELERQGKPSRAMAKPDRYTESLPEPEVFTPEESVAPLMDQPSTLAEAKISHPPIQPLSARSTPRPASSRQSSDAENQPPTSCLPRPDHPPSVMQSPFQSQAIRVPLAVTTPISSPSRNNISKLQTTFPWTAVDLEHIFEGTPTADKENSPFRLGKAGEKVQSLLTSPEKKLTVEEWIQSNAQRGEEKLRNECERLVGKFEDQGVRALKVLEGIVCAERP